MGRKMTKITTLSFDDLLGNEFFKGLINKYLLHEADLEIIRMGYECEFPPMSCPAPSDKIPFEVKGVTYTYEEFPPSLYRWYWEQKDLRKRYPQVANYMKHYKNWIKKKELDAKQFDDEEKEIIQSLTDL